MNNLSLKPDPDMQWIYDYTHPDYDSPHAKYLRDRRAAAIASAPPWMVEEARLNDLIKEFGLRLSSTAVPMPQCQYLGLPHQSLGQCPAVQKIEYYPDGTIKSVEKKP